jgi:oligopeptide/dipeptide ABC transporter ATP-binding protein
MIYQDPYESLDPRFSVLETIEEPLASHRLGKSRADRTQRVTRALERAGLEPPDLFLHRFAHELSGGQRQRVAIAASLVLEPELLIADEPVSMLDVSVRAGILSVLKTLRDAGLGILMITHDLTTAAQFADRIAVMYLGKIVEQGNAKSVIRDPRHPYTQALLAAVPGSRRTDESLKNVATDIAENGRVTIGCPFQPRCPYALEECGSRDPELLPVRHSQGAEHSAACILVEAE